MFDMMEFWGEEVPPGGKPFSVEVENEPPVFHMVHVTGCALGDAPSKGPHVLKALYNGKPIALATLDAAGARQAPLDFGISRSTTFVNAGPSPVFISGYITRSVQHIEGSDEEDEEEEEEDSEEEGSEEELEDSDAEEDLPRGRALAVSPRERARAPHAARGAPEGAAPRAHCGGRHGVWRVPLPCAFIPKLPRTASHLTAPPTQQVNGVAAKKKRASPFLDDEAEETSEVRNWGGSWTGSRAGSWGACK